MPKQPNGTPSKKPPAPSVKVRMGSASGSLDRQMMPKSAAVPQKKRRRRMAGVSG